VTVSNATVSQNGAYTVYVFIQSGSISFESNSASTVLIVGGGGGGGYSGYSSTQIEGAGGGGGGAVGIGNLQFEKQVTYNIEVGTGGARGSLGWLVNSATGAISGGESSISGGAVFEVAFGGGYGGSNVLNTGEAGFTHGCGGGGSAFNGNPGFGLGLGGTGNDPDMFYLGGDGAAGIQGGAGGGGGGASSAANVQSGGNGFTWSLDNIVYGGGGGGGGGGGTTISPAGTGGLGGGGSGGASVAIGASSGANTTGGGGGGAVGGFGGTGDGGNGGSGVVVIAIGNYAPSFTRDFGGAGGNPFFFICPPGTFIVTMSGRGGKWLDFLNVQCSLKLGAFGAGVGGDGGTAVDNTVPCPLGFNAIEITDRPYRGGDLDFIGRVLPFCDGVAYGTQIGQALFDPEGPYWNPPFHFTCPGNTVLVGMAGRSDVYVDNLRFICGPFVPANVSSGITITTAPTQTTRAPTPAPTSAPTPAVSSQCCFHAHPSATNFSPDSCSLSKRRSVLIHEFSAQVPRFQP